jgi:RNA polymerase sigma factor (sigma-70 family)
VTVKRQTELIAAYLSRREAIRRFLVARLGNAEEADDLLQELFLKAELAQPGEVREPAAYLFRMAQNLARDHRRERQRARKREADWADSETVTMGTDTVADAPSAEAALAAKQRIAAIRGALAELSPQCRRVFMLHKFDGVSHRDIARIAGISRSTVEKHMHTALKHLVERLGRD